MSTTKHTPGPWTVDRIECDCGRGSGHRIVTESDDLGSSENRANARLIASAPELLEALEHVVEMAPNHNHDWVMKARHAIAKATGQGG